MPESNSTSHQLLAIDSHVHLHDWVHLVPMLDAAIRSFTRAVGTYRPGAPFHGILVLTEPARRNTFGKLRDQLGVDPSYPCNPGWTLEATAEPLSLKASHANGTALFLVSGQQIVTGENLEVLSIGTAPVINDKLSLAGTIREIRQQSGFPLIPWGVGKWLGTRGKIVSRAISENAGQPLGLGDNSGRPAFWRNILQFTQAKAYNMVILRGSDPLALAGQEEKVGSFGTFISCPFDPQLPGASLVDALQDNSFSSIDFGELETFPAFCRNQLTLRL
jgi:hypothetical protein